MNARIIIIIFLLITQTGCEKWKIKRYPKWIVGTWKHTRCNPPIMFGGCHTYTDVYLDNGTWFPLSACSYCFILNESDCWPLSIDENERQAFIANWGWDPIADTLSYYFEDDKLIRFRHILTFDKTTPIIAETFEVKRMRNCKMKEGGKMILIDSLGSKDEYNKLIFKKSGNVKKCDDQYFCY